MFLHYSALQCLDWVAINTPLACIIDCFSHHTAICCCQYESSKFLWNIPTCLPKYIPLHPSREWPLLSMIWKKNQAVKQSVSLLAVIWKVMVNSYVGIWRPSQECNWRFCLPGCDSAASGYWYFKGVCCLHLQGFKIYRPWIHEDGDMFLPNIRNCLASNTASLPERPEACHMSG